MIYKSTLDCQKVQNNFTEVWQVLECLASFKKIFYNFQKFPGLPECQKYLPYSLTNPVMSCKIQNIFLWFLTVSWIARRSKKLLWRWTSPGMSFKLQNIFLWFFTVSWIVSRSKPTLLNFDKSWNVLPTSKWFSFTFNSLLDCQKVQDNFYEDRQVLECLTSLKIFFYDF